MGKKHFGFTLCKSKRYLTGFTIVEILVVVAIIGILATLITISVSKSKSKARDAQRMSDLDTMDNAIKLYHDENNSYPTKPSGCTVAWSGNPSNTNFWGSPTPCLNTTFIVGLTNYLAALPKDPGPYDANRGYFYQTDVTTNYKLWVHVPESFNRAPQSIWDPARDNQPDGCPGSGMAGGLNCSIINGNGNNGTAWAKYTPAWAAW